jgi:hypothetical protein
VAARLPRRAPRATAAPVAAAPAHDLALELRDGAIVPDPVAVPKGARVRLTVRNAGRAPVRLALAGYEDRVAVDALAADSTWSVAFTADRPGEDFPWMADGRPAGRFQVTGSHLVEGHR